MDMHYSEQNGLALIKLGGRLDIIGTGAIETKFSGYCSGENVRVVVDISEVDFLASIGIRLLMLTAKSVIGRGGRMALLKPIPDVKNVLEITGIPAIIPIFDSLDSAQAAVLA